MAITLGPNQTPQASFVVFMDGFEHYDDLSQKWTSVQSGGGATPVIQHEDGTYYGLADTSPLAADDLYEKDRGGVLYISGTHNPVPGGRGDVGGGWPYVQKYLQRQAVQKIHCAMNIKAEEYTGVPFLRFLNLAGDLIIGFCITPDGSIVTCRGTDTGDLRFPIKVGNVTPGEWTEISVGVGSTTPPGGAGAYGQGFFTAISVDGEDADGFGGYYAAAPANCQVYEVKLGAAGKDTYISDFVCHMGMLNEACCVHALRPEADIDQTSIGAEIGGDLLDLFGLSADGTIDDVRAWPPDGGSISLSGGCAFWGFYVTEDLRYPTDVDENVRFCRFLPFICNPFSTSLQVPEAVRYYAAVFQESLLAPKDVWMVHEFKGLEYHTYATCQVNALAQGGGMAFGITPYGPDWDSNYLQYQPRGGLKFDIVQVCHRHPYYRYMWNPMMLNWLPLGVMAMPEMIEDDARYAEYMAPCMEAI